MRQGQAYLRGLAALLSRFQLLGEAQFELRGAVTAEAKRARVSHEWSWVSHLSEFEFCG